MVSSKDVRRPWRPPTLRDISKEAGVSLATVSRVLSAGAGRHQGTPPTASKIVSDTAHAMGYVGAFKSGPQLVAFTSDIGRTGYRETLTGICDAARDCGAEIAIYVLSGSPEHRLRTLQSALRGRIDGAVLLEFDSPSVQMLRHLPRDLPFAIAGGYPSPDIAYPRAWIDDFQGAVIATQHLVELGHRRIGFVGLPPAGHPDPRVRGWQQVLNDESLPQVPQLGTGWSAETGLRAGAHAIQAGVTAVLCGNDDLAFGLLSGLSAAGIRVPQQISIVGMDDHPLAPSSVPPLTTVRLDFQQVGAAATRLALSETHEISSVLIPAELIVRGSTCPPADTG